MDHLNSHNPPKASLVPSPNHSKGLSNRPYQGSAYGFESESDDSANGLMDYWRVLKRNANKIILASLLGLVIGFAIGIPMKAIYRAKTALEILTINEDFMNMKQANPTTTNDNSYDTSEEATQAKLLESPALIKRVTSKLDDLPNTHVRPKLGIPPQGWRSWVHLPVPTQLTPREQMLAKAAASIKIRPTPRTRVLEITIDSTDPQLAMKFANTLTEEYMAQNMEARWSTNQRTSEWLRRELEDARDKLRRSEDALQTYARGSGLIFTDETTNVATEKLQQVQQSLSGATSDRIAKQSRFELAQNSPPDSLADVLNDTGLRETQSKINDIKRQIADLGAVFNPEYTKIKRLEAELETLQSAFDHSRTDILSRIRTDYEEARRKENLLAAAYKSQAFEVTGQDEKAIQYNILKRDVDSNRQLYDTMLQQMKEASIASAMRASNVRVVDPADLPNSPVSPNFQINSAIGALTGLLLSIAVVTVKEHADRTLQQPGDIKTWIDLIELGTVPNASIEHQKSTYGPSNRKASIASSAPALGYARIESERGGVTVQEAVELVTLQKKPSLIAEAFRSTLTSILFVGDNGSRPRVLVFTSANAADGKTTVASNLAIAAAEIRCKVLVIDADLRRPRMHQVFDVPNERGLSDLLQSDSDEGYAEHVKHTSIPYLHLLPAGPSTHAAAHLLYSPNFASLLAQFRSEYDMILIDTPPMLQMTDARVVGRIADAVILVARSGKTTRDAMIAAKDRLEEDRTRILGTVLNDWDPKRSPGGYYGYYQGAHYGSYRYAPAKSS
jgi:capsular exopolysaccharide synthesis family protein